MEEAFEKKRRISPWIIIILGFSAVILAGTLLLILPFSSRTGKSVPFGDAAFTAVSAVCVTGLVVRDTASCWSGFGQGVILALIQIGGLGVVTAAVSVTMLSGKKLSLFTRSTMQNAMSAPKLGGIVRLTRFVLRGTLIVELAGAAALAPSFVSRFGAGGVWYAVFHSVSAFCNAGFDVMGSETGAFSSLTAFSSNAAVVLPVMLLIVIGGIGFVSWDDVCTHRLKVSKYGAQTKIVLAMTAILIVFPAAWLFFADLKGLPFGERLLSALFQAVTPRTAGFNTCDLTSLSGPSKAMMTALMLIGGSPGSTAGGMKTTSVALLAANVVAVFKKKEDAELFGRRIKPETVRTAGALFVMYLTLFFIGAAAISRIEGLPLEGCMFETASALGTVGLTLGLTPGLGWASRCILMLLMFIGRVGGMTFVYAFLPLNGRSNSKLPVESVMVG
ncbi:MAG: Trk family potassium uptake protein [Clostridia bacterium]|nr:Trk family potassium uptake protein [Clostridia bacterium]